MRGNAPRQTEDSLLAMGGQLQMGLVHRMKSLCFLLLPVVATLLMMGGAGAKIVPDPVDAAGTSGVRMPSSDASKAAE